MDRGTPGLDPDAHVAAHFNVNGCCMPGDAATLIHKECKQAWQIGNKAEITIIV